MQLVGTSLVSNPSRFTQPLNLMTSLALASKATLAACVALASLAQSVSKHPIGSPEHRFALSCYLAVSANCERLAKIEVALLGNL